MLACFIENGREYGRTDSGRWSSVPREIFPVNVLTPAHYDNATNERTARFFHAKRSFDYFSEGYFCCRFAIVSPGGDIRRVYDYKPISIPDTACGYRERWIIQNAYSVCITNEGGREVITFRASDPDNEGGARTCAYCVTSGAFVG